MNQQPPQDDGAFERSSFIHACVYCGARFEVLVSRQHGNDEHEDEDEDYACPECGKGYSVRAALPPLVNLVHARSDGKGDRYQETMF
jgi:DNA-directed RNA polymerase subunit RPC12/RpoP